MILSIYCNQVKIDVKNNVPDCLVCILGHTWAYSRLTAQESHLAVIEVSHEVLGIKVRLSRYKAISFHCTISLVTLAFIHTEIITEFMRI